VNGFLIASWLGLVAVAQTGSPGETIPSEAQVRETIRKGLDFLMSNQEPDGSWGHYRNAGADEFWTNPETHRSWTVAVTGLVCLTLVETGLSDANRAAYEKGINYVLDNALVKRPNEWDVDNTWAYVYALPALVDAYRRLPETAAERRARVKTMTDAVIAILAETQTPSGGWGYYDFDAYTNPGSWATSFMTAVVVLGLQDAKEAGFIVDDKMYKGAVKAVKRCRLPTGAYTYSVEAVPSPRHSEWIDQIKGSLGRIQVCNLALLRAGEEMPKERLTEGLDWFFNEHRFLDIARKKPIPHETYYLNSGYFYFFGHFYAAEVIRSLPPEDQSRYWGLLQREVVKTKEADGSMWDYYMNSYHRPYGTAFGVMSLSQSLRPHSLEPAKSSLHQD